MWSRITAANSLVPENTANSRKLQSLRGVHVSRGIDWFDSKSWPDRVVHCRECCGGLDVLARLYCQASNHKSQHFLKSELHLKNTLLITIGEKIGVSTYQCKSKEFVSFLEI